MAITKRVRVALDFKIVFPTEDVEQFTKDLVASTKRLANGEKLSGEDLAMVLAALNGGPEAAIELHLKSVTSKLLKETLRDAEAKPGNVQVVFKQ